MSLCRFFCFLHFVMSRELRFRVEGMHCGACVVTLMQALMEVPGTEDARVDFRSETATVVTAPGASEERYFLAVERAGYRAVSGVAAQSPVEMRYARWCVMIWGAAIVTILVVLLLVYGEG